jgi:ubiquinone/menaquinone biosynthesis C-methylase UbiE
MKKFKKGSVESFQQNWVKRPETNYNHFKRGAAINQIQFAFQNHFKVFNELIFSEKNKYKILEVGCGRGSLSAYFSDKGHDCHLLDISKEIINTAQEIFKHNNLKGSFYVEDAEKMNFQDNSFDIVFSIGLMEHFKDIEKILDEKIRVLKKGGSLFLYIVPEYNGSNIQKDYNWINEILKNNEGNHDFNKNEVFRSDDDSKKYLNYLKNKVEIINSSGIYSVPMISPSISFPFTLMKESQELVLINYYKSILKKRKEKYPNINPWLCEEGFGQAFLIWAKK